MNRGQDTVTKTLYICYFGLLEPLVQTQVLPYLRELAYAGHRVSLLTFEPQRFSRDQHDHLRTRLHGDGISWYSLRYHKRPSVPATLFDVLSGALFSIRLARREGVDVLHARSHVSMAMALLARRLTGSLVVFDLRGLLAEEYIDGGVWREGSPVVRLVRRFERYGLAQSDQTIVLTRRLRDELVAKGRLDAHRVHVIPCCTDTSLYSPGPGKPHTRPPLRGIELIYAGSLTGLYQFEEMIAFFTVLQMRLGQCFFRILTPANPVWANALLSAHGVDPSAAAVEFTDPASVPQRLLAATVGISFRKATASQVAASPTKVAEYLAAGLPVVSTAGIGDMDEILVDNRVGVLVRSYDTASLREAVVAMEGLLKDPELRSRCREVARRHFDLSEVGARGYRRVYERLAAMRPSDRPMPCD